MELYTCQNAAVYDNIVKNGYHVCDVRRSYWFRMFTGPYRWLARRLGDKIAKPRKVNYPIWAYRELPKDFDYHTDGEPGEECVFLRLEVPDEKVVCIDAKKWADVVTCGVVYPYDADNEEVDRIDAYYENASREEREANWEGVFDVSRCESGVEVLFWSIESSYVKEVTHYTCVAAG